MAALLEYLYNFGSSLCSYQVQDVIDILTFGFTIGDTSFTLLSVLLPTGFFLYMGYALTKWVFDIIF